MSGAVWLILLLSSSVGSVYVVYRHYRRETRLTKEWDRERLAEYERLGEAFERGRLRARTEEGVDRGREAG